MTVDCLRRRFEMKRVQIDYLRDRLKNIINTKLQDRRKQMIPELLELLKNNPPMLLSVYDVSDYASCWSSFYSHDKFNELYRQCSKAVKEYGQALEAQKEAILDEAVLGNKDITALIKSLEEM